MSNQPTVANGPKGLTQAQKDREVEYVAFGSKNLVRLTVNMVRETLCKPSKSGHLPSDTDCLRFMKKCQSQQLDPWLDEAYLVGYDRRDGRGADFQMITGYRVYLKRAEIHPDFKGYQSGVIILQGNDLVEREGDLVLKGEVLVGGFCRVYRKNLEFPISKKANLATNLKNTDFWGRDPGMMIVKIAESDAFNSAFPSTVGHLFMEASIEEGTFFEREETVNRPQFGTDTRVLAERSSVLDEYGITAQPPEKPKEKPAPKQPAKKKQPVKPEPVPNQANEMSPQEELAEQRERDAVLAEQREIENLQQQQVEEAKETAQEPAGEPQLNPSSPQGMLNQKLTEAGFNFNDLVGWACNSQNYPDADTHASIAEIPEHIAARWLKAWTGLRIGLQAFKARITQ